MFEKQGNQILANTGEQGKRFSSIKKKNKERNN